MSISRSFSYSLPRYLPKLTLVLLISAAAGCGTETRERLTSMVSDLDGAKVEANTSPKKNDDSSTGINDESSPRINDDSEATRDEALPDSSDSALLLTEGRFRCRAAGAGGREADLRLENKSGQSDFRAKWEINVGQGQVVGTRVKVAIAGVSIGDIVLRANGSQLVGDIRLSGKNLPAAVQSVKAGTPVLIGSLTCNFARD